MTTTGVFTAASWRAAFELYRLELDSNGVAIEVSYNSSATQGLTPLSENAVIDTAGMPDGFYWVRLTHLENIHGDPGAITADVAQHNQYGNSSNALVDTQVLLVQPECADAFDWLKGDLTIHESVDAFRVEIGNTGVERSAILDPLNTNWSTPDPSGNIHSLEVTVFAVREDVLLYKPASDASSFVFRYDNNEEATGLSTSLYFVDGYDSSGQHMYMDDNNSQDLDSYNPLDPAETVTTENSLYPVNTNPKHRLIINLLLAMSFTRHPTPAPL